MLSWDPSPLLLNSKVGDFEERLTKLTPYLKEIHVICYVPKHIRYFKRRIVIDNTLFIYATPPIPPYLFPLYSIHIARKILKKTKIDLINTQDPLLCGLAGYMLSRLYKIPFLPQLHGDYLDNPFWISEEFNRHLLNKLGKFILRKGDIVRVVSQRTVDFCASLGIPLSRIYYLPVGVNYQRFIDFGRRYSAEEIRKKYKLSKENILLFVGRLAKQKGIDILIRAMSYIVKIIPNLHLLIVGKGEEYTYLKELTAKLNLENYIIFTGYVKKPELPSLYYISDIFVLPSRYEGLSIALQEAALFGKPIVATKVSGSAEVVINNKTGYLVKPENSKDLADTLIRALNNSKLKDNASSISKQLIKEKFDIDHLTKRRITLFKKAISLRPENIH